MKSITGEDVSLPTIRESDTNNHIILAVANPHHWKNITLRGCSYLRISLVEPWRLGRPINAKRLFGDKAVLPITNNVDHKRGGDRTDNHKDSDDGSKHWG